MQRSFILTLTALSMAACGPKPETMGHLAAKSEFGPRLQDTDVAGAIPKDLKRKLVWNGQNSSSSYSAVVNHLSELETFRPSIPLQSTLKSLVAAEIAKSKTVDQAPTKGEYFSLLIEQKKDKTVTKLVDMRADIRTSLDKVKGKVISFQPPQISPGEAFRPHVDKAFGYYDQLIKWMKDQNLNASVISAIQDEGGKLVAKWKTKIYQIVSIMDKEKNLRRFIEPLVVFLKNEGIVLPANVKSDLNSALTLGKLADNITTAQSALTALVYVWLMLPSGERYSTFKQINAELADLFKDADNADLNCLAGTGGCGIIMGFKKDGFVLPAIEAHPPSKIKTDLNARGVDRVKAKLMETVNSKTANFTGTVTTMIDEKFASATVILDLMINDFTGTIGSRLDNTGLREANMLPFGFSTTQASESAINIGWQLNPEPVSMDNKAAQVGGLAAMFKHGGLATGTSESLFLGILSDAANEYRDGSDVLQFQSSPKFAAKDFARIVDGYARLLTLARSETQRSAVQRVFDLSAQNLFTEAKSDFLTAMKIYPSEVVSSLFLYRLSKLLDILQGANSPVFLLDLDSKISWANETQKSTSVTAGIVNREQGQRQDVVYAEDVARTIIALSQFLQATKGIEDVVKDYADVATVTKGRARIRLLVLAMSNYLSHNFRRDDGLIESALRVSTQTAFKADVRLLDQALAIRAFLAAESALEVEIYKWEAVDTYFALNAGMFDPSLGFYRSGLTQHQTMQAPEFLEVLSSIALVRDALASDSQNQLRYIVNPWITMIEKTSFTAL